LDYLSAYGSGESSMRRAARSASLAVVAVIGATLIGGCTSASSSVHSQPQTLAMGGDGFGCVVVDLGTVKCWGSNDGSILGTDQIGYSMKALRVPGLQGVRVIAAGFEHVCALDARSRVLCWGNVTEGPALPLSGVGLCRADGNPSGTGCDPRPRLMLTDALALGAGGSCAVVVGGRVACWGLISYDGGEQSTMLRPQSIPGIEDAVQVAASARGGCALLRTGRVECWGANRIGARPPVGPKGPGICRAIARAPGVCSVVARPIAGVRDATGIEVEEANACATLRRGAVECWTGGPISGAGCSPVSAPRPCAVAPLRFPGLPPIAQFAFGCVLTTAGAVRCWGDNSDGQLGNGSTAGGTQGSVTELVPKLPPSVAVASEPSANCARAADGSVRCWGILGNSTVATINPSPTVIPGLP
jgi:alpha-tubulin suppressor-like RCC1 family protein